MVGTKSKEKRQFWWLNWSPMLTFSIVFILIFVLSYLRLDPDFGWHLAAGDYFLHHGIPKTDIFTYTAADFPWVDHEWLSDCLLFLLHSIGGYTLLAAVYAALWTLSFFIIGRRVYGPLVLLGTIAVLPFAGVRAVTWTVLGVVLVYIIVKTSNKQWRFLLPLLFLLWANIHGGFAIGLALIAYWTISERSKRLLVLLILSFAVTFINPYGIDLYVEIFRTTFDGSLRWVISEWVPIGSVWQTLCYVAIWAAGFLLLLGKKWRSYLQVDFLLFLAAMSSIRHYPLFIVLSLPFTAKYIKHFLTKIPRQLDLPKRKVIWLIIGIISLISAWSLYDIYNGPLDREEAYPRSAVAYLTAHPCSGNLFNTYESGGYFIWKLPTQKVYIDGRMPSWEGNGHKYMTDYLKILNDSVFRNEQFRTYNITCALVAHDDRIIGVPYQLKKSGWKVVSDANGYVLLEK
ncbi:MAG: hypothetical protein ABIQ04_04525 [Candidatus Saccharimonadales bacterium]